MIVILEGCDGTGKTTLAEFLCRLIPDSIIIHCTRETPNTLEWFYDIISSAKVANKTLILDRGMYGQFVYQEKSERNLSYEDLENLESYLKSIDARVIWVDANKKDIEARLSARSEELSVPFETIQNRYEDLFENSILDVIHLNTSNFGVYYCK